MMRHIMSDSTTDVGVVYLLTGPSHAVRLATSLLSLREHYRGAVHVFTTQAESHQIGRAISADKRLNVCHFASVQQHQGKNSSFLTKLDFLQTPPFERTAYLDADTLVVGDVAPLFEFTEGSQVIATQFARWSSDRRPVRGRIERWRQLPQKRFLGFGWKTLIDSAVQPHPAVNGGVFAVRRGAELLKTWHELSLLGRETFICDEIALQILLHHFPHQLLDCRWNCSPQHARRQTDVRIWHLHGEKHLRPAALSLWLPWYERAINDNIGDIREWTPAGDRRLAKHLSWQPVTSQISIPCAAFSQSDWEKCESVELPKTPTMKIEVVAHCWRYWRLLTYQAGGFVADPPPDGLEVVYRLFMTREDVDTVRRVEILQSLKWPANVTFQVTPLPAPQLFRRAIGRNIAALESQADVVWFTDCDYIISSRSLTDLSAAMQSCQHSFVFPEEVLEYPHEESKRLIEAANEWQAPSRIRLPPEMKKRRYRRAIGGIQIVKGDLCREHGYLNRSTRWQKPQECWQRCFDDVAFRKQLAEVGITGHGVPISQVVRLMHAKRDRCDAEWQR